MTGSCLYQSVNAIYLILVPLTVKQIIISMVPKYLNSFTSKDLDIKIASDQLPMKHINEIVLRAHQRANLIICCFTSGEFKLVVKGLIVYVRSILEYNSIIWSPCLKKDIDIIEKVQRQFTMRLHGMKNLTYGNQIAHLGIPSLELHRRHLDLMYCYKSFLAWHA